MLAVILLSLVAGAWSQSCDLACDDYKQPVCGSDGQTYLNPCYLKMAACKYATIGKQLTLVHEGECRSDPGNVKPAVGTATGTADRCNMDCTGFDHLLICGSDGVTYNNKCEFSNAVCLASASGQTLSPASIGSACKDASISVTADRCGDALARCDSTPQRICGSDGNVYGSDCEFKKAQCGNPRLTQVRCYDPTLTGTGSISVTADRCREALANCDSTTQRICGSDGNHYSSDCEFKKAQCANPRLTQVRCADPSLVGSVVGTVDACAFTTCDSTPTKICASNGRVYGSECEFMKYNCLSGGHIAKVDCATLAVAAVGK